MTQLNQIDTRTAYIENQLVNKGLILPFNNSVAPNNDIVFKIANTPPANGMALVWNDTLDIYEPQLVGVGTPLSNTEGDGATILKGTTELKTIDNETGSLLTIINGTDKISLGLQVNTTPNILLIGYTPPVGLKEPVVIPLNNTHFNTTGSTLSLNTISTSLISNGAITTAKMANIGASKLLISDGTGVVQALPYYTPISLNNNALSLRYLRNLISNAGPITTITIGRGTPYYVVESNTAFNHQYSINTSAYDNIITSSLNEAYEFKILIINTNPTSNPLFNFTHAQGATSSKLGITSDNCWDPNSQSIQPLTSKLYKFTYINGQLPTTLNYIINDSIIPLSV